MHVATSERSVRRVLIVLCALIVAALIGLGIIIGNKIDAASTAARSRAAAAAAHATAAANRAKDQATQAAIAGLHDQAVLFCRRLNVTRATDNQAHLQNYQLYAFLIRGVRHESAAKRARQNKATRREIHRLEQGQRNATWTQLSNCTVPHEARRSLSLNPIPFSRRLPPNSALNARNARRPNPTGSVP